MDILDIAAVSSLAAEGENVVGVVSKSVDDECSHLSVFQVILSQDTLRMQPEYV